MDSSLERLLRSDIYRVDSDIVVGPRTTLRPSPFGIADIRKGLDIRLIETFQGNLFFFNADHHPGLISTSSTSWIIQNLWNPLSHSNLYPDFKEQSFQDVIMLSRQRFQFLAKSSKQ